MNKYVQQFSSQTHAFLRKINVKLIKSDGNQIHNIHVFCFIFTMFIYFFHFPRWQFGASDRSNEYLRDFAALMAERQRTMTPGKSQPLSLYIYGTLTPSHKSGKK